MVNILVFIHKHECKIILSNVIGTELASIHSSQDNTVARGAMNNNNGWFGFNDLTSDGTWVWTDGTPSDYYNWSPNEPNGGTGENCVELLASSSWNDISCNHIFYWLVCNHPS